MSLGDMCNLLKTKPSTPWTSGNNENAGELYKDTGKDPRRGKESPGEPQRPRFNVFPFFGKKKKLLFGRNAGWDWGFFKFLLLYFL